MTDQPTYPIEFITQAMKKHGYGSESFKLGVGKKAFVRFYDSDTRQNEFVISAENPLYPLPTASSRLICNNKPLAYDFVEQLGFSVPNTIYVIASDSRFDAAKDMLTVSKNLVVKPAKASMSNGVTLNVDTEEKLETAIVFARKYSSEVIVQVQFFGEEVRFAVSDGVAKAALLRQTPQVIGDGTSTVQELIIQENIARSEIEQTVVEYPELADEMLLKTIDKSYVPYDQEVFKLGTGTMVRHGASMYNITDSIDKSYLEIATGIGGGLGRGFVAVDIMIKDVTQPASLDNYVFIEYNTTPAIQLFYGCRDGKQFDIADECIVPSIIRMIKAGQ